GGRRPWRGRAPPGGSGRPRPGGSPPAGPSRSGLGRLEGEPSSPRTIGLQRFPEEYATTYDEIMAISAIPMIRLLLLFFFQLSSVGSRCPVSRTDGLVGG